MIKTILHTETLAFFDTIDSFVSWFNAKSNVICTALSTIKYSVKRKQILQMLWIIYSVKLIPKNVIKLQALMAALFFFKWMLLL